MRIEAMLSCSYTPSYCVNGLVKKCSACGAGNRDEANYCLRCGESVVVRPVGPQSSLGEPSATYGQPFGVTAGCLFHPLFPSQLNCVSCSAPICLMCARYDLRNVLCPICYARRFPLTLRGEPFFGPTFRYPRFGPGIFH
jgi:hypothetical protein